MPIFGSKDKNGNLACNFMHVDGIPKWGNYDYPVGVCLTQDDAKQRLAIAQRLSKVPPKFLPYNQIISIGKVFEEEIIEQNKSVVGRAAVGTLLLGPLGGIIGGLSGTGTKKTKKYRKFFIINYHPADNPDEINVISFEIVGATMHLNKFSKALQSKIPQAPPEPVQPASQYL